MFPTQLTGALRTSSPPLMFGRTMEAEQKHKDGRSELCGGQGRHNIGLVTVFLKRPNDEVNAEAG